MKKQVMFIFAGIASVLSACSSYNYYAVSNKPLNSQYNTYAWIPGGKSKAAKIYDNDIATDLFLLQSATGLC